MGTKSTSKSGRKTKGSRAALHPYLKANPDCPLSWHKASKRWYKTHRGQFHYFGSDPEQAMREYLDKWPYITRGLAVPDPDAKAGPSVRELINGWLHDRKDDIDTGRLKDTTWAQYRLVGEFIADHLGRTRSVASLTPDDFSALAKAMRTKWGSSPTVLSRSITISRMPFKWGWDMGRIDAVRFGPRFKKPSVDERDAKRHEHGRQHYTAPEIHKLLNAASLHMRAFILLAINGGFTQTEISGLRPVDVDLGTGVIDYYRHKTKVRRKVPLWPATVEAIIEAIEYRPSVDDDLLFTTKYGNPYEVEGITDKGKLTRSNGIGQEFNKLKNGAGIKLKLSGFGKLRHTHRTVADEARDPNAARLIMGHKLGRGEVEASYIKTVSDERLLAVTDHIHQWLYGKKP